MAASELKQSYKSGYSLVARVDTKDGEKQILVGWVDPNGKRPSQELWIAAAEAPSTFRALAAFADGQQ